MINRPHWMLAFALFCSVSLPAQNDETPLKVTNQNRTGPLPFSSTIGTDIESVDASSGNLIVRIPITGVQGRGVDFKLALRYDALFWAVGTYSNGGGTSQIWKVERRNWLPLSGLGWELNIPRVTRTKSQSSICPNLFGMPTGEATEVKNYIYHDENGTKHPLEVWVQYGFCELGQISAIQLARGAHT
jgi:hypothetical protein